MSLFNHRILEASIRDVIVNLSDALKADVLLYALQHLPVKDCRTILENAVQSLLQVPNLPSADMARALLLRAKVRLTAGYRTSAQQDLHTVLMTDPENQDAKVVIQSLHTRSEFPLREPGCPHLSEEVWREIALYLPKRDLKSLLFVPNVLSRISSQLLFREVDLHLTTAMDPGGVGDHEKVQVDEDVDEWHSRRNADILTRILVDSHFACRIKCLRIFADSSRTTPPLRFKVGILVNALPRLLNLRKVHCSGNNELVSRVLQVVHLYNPRLRQLSIVVPEGLGIEVPPFKHLTHLAISSHGGSRSPVRTFLAHNLDTLRCLSIKNSHWQFPTPAISTRGLTQIEFSGRLSGELFMEIFDEGLQLESVMLSGMLGCTPSAGFRNSRHILPFLRHFSLTITTLQQQLSDRDLCPAISEFIREHTQLRTYRLLVPSSIARCVGFDAAAWGVLSVLSKLSSLSITYPEGLPPALAGWLVPRTVRALTLDLSAMPDGDTEAFMDQLRMGMPPELGYIGIDNVPTRFSPRTVVEHGFPNVRVAQIDGDVWTITRPGDNGALEMDYWPYRRVKYYSAEWLEELGCVDAIWKSVDGL